MTQRRNLIFCAFGPPPGTVPFVEEKSERNWDLVEVLWHPKMIEAHRAGRYETIADKVLVETDRAKRKFTCFADAWSLRDWAFPTKDYDAVMIADDDLTPAECTWSDVFDLFHESKLSVAQAALTRDSTRVWSWPVTHQDPSHVPNLMSETDVAKAGRTQYRTTDFVEVMAPIFTKEAIEAGVPYFLDEPYGLGLETWWHQAYAKKGELGVLDATPMRHTRPLGSAHSMTGTAEHPFAIAEAFRKRHGFPTVFAEDTCWTLARWGKDAQGKRMQLPSLPPVSTHDLSTPSRSHFRSL